MSCESPAVQERAREIFKGGELVAEVGFFGKERRYFIRPNMKTDSVDEEPAFLSFHKYFLSSFKNMFQEPDLAAEYYKDWFAYATQGLDLNPYIDRHAIKGPYTPQDIQLERVLSYKIDTTEGMSDETYNYWFKDLWHLRLRGFKEYRGFLQRNLAVENMKFFQNYFYYQAFSLEELRELADSVQKHPGLYDEFPFLTQVYEEYKTKMETVSFANFIQIHPAVIYDSADTLFRFPYEDSEENVLSRLFRKYNEFSKCIEEHKAQINTCDQLEEKQAFIRLMLDAKDDFFQRSL